MHSLIHLHLSAPDLDRTENTRHITDAHQSLIHLGSRMEAALVFSDPQTIRRLALRLTVAADAMERAQGDTDPTGPWSPDVVQRRQDSGA